MSQLVFKNRLGGYVLQIPLKISGSGVCFWDQQEINGRNIVAFVRELDPTHTWTRGEIRQIIIEPIGVPEHLSDYKDWYRRKNMVPVPFRILEIDQIQTILQEYHQHQTRICIIS